QDVLELHTQFTLQQFATRVAWQAVNKYHTAGRLEMGQPAAAEIDDLLFGQGLALSDDHECGHRLDPVGVGQAHDGDFADLVELVNGFFHLAAGNVFATRLDHVLLAVHHGDEALGIDDAQVATMEPASFEGGGGTFCIVVVAQQQLGGAVHDFPYLAWRHVAHGVVHHAGFHVQRRAPGRACARNLLVRIQHRGHRRDLCLTIEVPKTHAGQTSVQLFEDLYRHDGRAIKP